MVEKGLFPFLMGSALNAYIIAKDCNAVTVTENWPSFQDFVEDLAEDLIGNFETSKHPPGRDDSRPARVHKLAKIFNKEKVCVECRASSVPGSRGKTSKFGCVQCQVAVHTLCFPNHIYRADGQGQM